MVEKAVKLPDGEILTDARKSTIESGYDHYWRFHENEREWAKLGCPVCKSKQEEEPPRELVDSAFCEKCGFKGTPLCTHPDGYYQDEPAGLNKMLDNDTGGLLK